MDKKTFEAKTAELWELYTAAKTLTSAAALPRVTSEQLQAKLCHLSSAISEQMVHDLRGDKAA